MVNKAGWLIAIFEAVALVFVTRPKTFTPPPLAMRFVCEDPAIKKAFENYRSNPKGMPVCGVMVDMEVAK